MSKCDLEIEFDRADRTYRGGETVSGTVRVSVNKDTRCRGIRLEYFWATHGRGNRDGRKATKIQLADECDLRAGERFELPFEFPADRQPLTYRGKLIYVDHYVKVKVDLPWAFDPKRAEEIIVTGGIPPASFDGQRGKLVNPNAAKEATGWVKWLLIGIIGIGLIALSIAAVILLPFVLIGLAIWYWRKQSIKSRVGEVDCQIPHLVMCPGEQFPVHLKFTARKSFDINAISLKLTCQESARSGSGTDARTYTNSVYSRDFELMAAQRITVGDTIDEQLVFDLPDLDAWSIDLGDNHVIWQAIVRIDIPRAPDWSKTTKLQLVPATWIELAETSSSPVPPIDSPVESAPVSTPSFEQPADHSPPTFQDPERDDEPTFAPYFENDDSATLQDAPVQSPELSGHYPSLDELLAHVRAADRYGSDRENVIEEYAGTMFEVMLEVDRVVSTFGASDQPAHRDGRTITGTIAGTDQAIEFFGLNVNSNQHRLLGRGENLPVLVTVSKWDNLYERLEVFEVE